MDPRRETPVPVNGRVVDLERQRWSYAFRWLAKGRGTWQLNRPESGPAADPAAGERNEAALVAKALRGDGPAFEALLRPYERRTYRTVLRITGNPADAADVYQDVVLAAFENIGSFRHAAAFGTWLHRIAVNCALMRRRTATRHPVISEEDLPQFNWMGRHGQPVHNWAESADAPAERAELRAALTNALAALPAVDRAIVWMKDAEGLAHEEIAAATGLSVLATRARLHRARLRLRAWLSTALTGAAAHPRSTAGGTSPSLESRWVCCSSATCSIAVPLLLFFATSGAQHPLAADRPRGGRRRGVAPWA